MEYENGFYVYIPSEEAAEDMHELSIPQVIEIIEGEVWLSGTIESFDTDYAESVGNIGKMVMSQDGKIINPLT
tara:strand:+ start:248 stop:466 length:219 start_codon:yes stop_codon:yes gene_type:complete